MFGVKLKSTKKPTAQPVARNTDTEMLDKSIQEHLRSPRRRQEDSEVEQSLGKLRMSLRKIPAHRPRPPPRTSSRKYKLACRSAPYFIRKSPMFGVVLKPRVAVKDSGDPTTNGDEKGTTEKVAEQPAMLDLDFKDQPIGDVSENGTSTATTNGGSGRSFSTKNSIDTKENNGPAFFGVRLKPTRRMKHNPLMPKTYQIDLTPPPLKEANKIKGTEKSYQSDSRAFLEIKLKPRKRNNKDSMDDTPPDFVELELRHVVAPPDGGPKRTVTEATFSIPFLKHVDMGELFSKGSNDSENWKPGWHDPLQELLQMTIEDLRHIMQNPKGEFGERLLQIRLRHVHPKTGVITDLGQTIQVALRSHTPEEHKDSGAMPPSMKVSLKHVEPKGGTISPGATPEFANVRLQHVNVVEHQHGEDGDFDNGLLSVDSGSEGGVVESDSEEDDGMMDESLRMQDVVQTAGEKPKNMRSSLPEINVGELPQLASMEDVSEDVDDEKTEPSTDQEEGVEESDEEEIEDLFDTDDEAGDGDNANSNGKKKRRKKKKKGDDAGVAPRKGRDLGGAAGDDNRSRPTRRMPARTRSSSLTDFDRMKARRDHYLEIKSKELEEGEEKRELTIKQKRDLLMWYNRMKTPNRQRMKERVALLPSSCDITPDDVELLPWLCKGRYLDLRVMNQYFMEDWQGSEKKKTDGNNSD